jgi:hypothetical protein
MIVQNILYRGPITSLCFKSGQYEYISTFLTHLLCVISYEIHQIEAHNTYNALFRPSPKLLSNLVLCSINSSEFDFGSYRSARQT